MIGNIELMTLNNRSLVARDAADDAQYLTFTLAGEHYGVPILRVQEIRGWTTVTRLPGVPAFVCGVMNLRGTVVSVVDLRRRFGLETVDYSKTTVVIVVAISGEQGDRIMGIVVDGVSDVLDVMASEVQAAPDFGTTIHTGFIHGLVMTETGMIMLLDMNQLFSVDELFALEAVNTTNLIAA